MRIEIRPATRADDESLRELAALTTAELRIIYRPTAAAIAGKAKMSPALTRLVAIVNETLAGTLEYKLEGDRVHIIGLAVHPQHRRRGMARAMIDALVAIGKSHNLKTISLYTIMQTGNVPIFERLGFRVARESPPENLIGDSPLTEAFMQRMID